MRIGNVDLMPDASEIVHYSEDGIPLYISRDALSRYPGFRAAAHWHEDLEWIEIEEGEMYYSVNGKTVLLKEGDSLVVNAKQLHFGFGLHQRECVFICILIHPSLLTGSCAAMRDQLDLMLNDSGFPCYHFSSSGRDSHALTEFCQNGSPLSDPEDVRLAAASFRNKSGIDPAGSRLVSVSCSSKRTVSTASLAAALLRQTVQEKQSGTCGYCFRAVGMLTTLTGLLLEQWQKGTDARSSGLQDTDPRLFLQRKMVAFIEENFASEITLDGIAHSAAVSRSTCCRLFQTYVHCSPLEFVNSYRLQRACELLRTTSQSITEIASRCGFNYTSYFSQLFQRSYGCTPREFRRKACSNKGQNT